MAATRRSTRAGPPSSATGRRTSSRSGTCAKTFCRATASISTTTTTIIELNGRDQFDIGANNVHPDFGAGPIDVHGTAKVRTYTFDNAFTFIKSDWAGNHTFKAGFGWSQNGVNPIIQGGNDNGTFEFLHNLPFNPANASTYPSLFSIRLGEIYFDLTDKRTNLYFQDKWQINRNLSLNLGLRYDYQDMTPETKAAFAPRLGFAYDPTGEGKMVVRGGVGKFYEYQLIGILSDLTQLAVISPAFQFETDEDESPLDGELPSDPCLRPVGSGGLANISPACRAILTTTRAQVGTGSFVNSEPIVDGDRRLGYLWSFSLGVQRELMPNVGLTADYVGNRGRDQTGLIDINEPPPARERNLRAARARRVRSGRRIDSRRRRVTRISSACSSSRRATTSTPTTTHSRSASTSGMPIDGAAGSPIRCHAHATSALPPPAAAQPSAPNASSTISTRALTTASPISTTATRLPSASTSTHGAGWAAAACSATTPGYPINEPSAAT